MQHFQRRGYGLFQLFVILAFLLLLLAMLLPAVQKVRQAASRMESSNNLKQLGLAHHNFHEANQSLTTGVDSKNFSGLVNLLPYVEQDVLYRSIERTTSPDDKDNVKARATRVPVFVSTLDEVTQADPKAGPTNYFLVAGSKAPLEDNNGLFYRDSAIRLAAITDGTSNTMMMVESLKGNGETKAQSVQRQHVRLKKEELKALKETAGEEDFKEGKNIAGNRGASWLDGRFLQSTFTATRKFNDSRPDVDCGGEGGLSAPRSHQQGANVLFGDGSVRFISGKVAFDTWKALATRSGGEVIGDL